MGVKLSKTSGIFCAVLLWLGLGFEARAGTWILANGDRLTGELVNETLEFVVVQHAQLGRLKVPRTALRQPDETGAKSGARPGGLTQTAAADSKAIAKPEETPKWKRQIELGYVQQSGATDKQDLVIRAQVDGKEGDNTFRAIGRVLRSESEGKTLNDRREGEFRWRYDVSRRLFAQALTNYEEDAVRKIDLNLEQQIGGGYRVLDTERQKGSVGLGAVVQYLQRQNANEQTALLGALFQDYSYQWNSRFKLIQEANFMVSDTGTLSTKVGQASTSTEGSYRMKFTTGVQSKVTNQISLNVRFEYDYDRSVLEPDLRMNQRLTTSLGYLW